MADFLDEFFPDSTTYKQMLKDGVWPHDGVPIKGLLPYMKRMKGNVNFLEIAESSIESSCLVASQGDFKPSIVYFHLKGNGRSSDNGRSDDELQENDAGGNVVQNARDFVGQIRFAEGNTIQAFNGQINAIMFDFIFITGNVAKSLEILQAAYPLLRDEGIMAGHIYKERADQLKEFRKEVKYGDLHRVYNDAWFFYKPKPQKEIGQVQKLIFQWSNT
jgi:hypothetical protein